jgi:hypothetical protein
VSDAPAPPRLVFLHLQKTGGTSLHERLVRRFTPAEICPERYDKLEEWEGRLGGYAFFSGHYSIGSLALIPGPYRVVTALREPRARLVSLYLFWTRFTQEWRDRNPHSVPAAAHRCADFEAFLRHPAMRSGTDNEMTRRLAGKVEPAANGGFRLADAPLPPERMLEMAATNLRRLAFVGVTEALDALYARVAAAHGWPEEEALPRLNTRDDTSPHFTAAREVVMTPAAEALLEQRTRLDRRLHALARELAGLA